VVGGLVEDKGVGIEKHHARQHAANLLAGGENSCFLEGLSPGKSILPRNPREKLSPSMEGIYSRSQSTRVLLAVKNALFSLGK